MTRLAYYDYFNNSISEQIEIFKKSDNTFGFVLRNVCGEHFTCFNFESYLSELKPINVLAIDLINKNLDNEIISEKINYISQHINFKYMIVNLKNDATTYENINYIKRISTQYKDKTILIEFPYDMKAVDIKSFLETVNMKNCEVYFSPMNLFQNKLSYTLEYRIIKKYVGAIKICDIDIENKPTLIGYGTLDLIDFYKRLYENMYSGCIVYDTNIPDILSHYDKDEKKFGSYKFRGKYKKDVAFFALKVKGSAEKLVGMDEVFINQIEVINKIFKM